jgi:hypothetical protein
MAVGYRYVALDLSGYRIGSLNEVLQASARTGQEPAKGAPQAS